MRKKYLSALLFGALLFASAGTFTSCKDYDDDIDGLRTEITDLKSAVTELQNAVQNGKYVTAVSGNGNVITFTFSDGSTTPITIETESGEPSQTVTIGEDGEIIINGEGTGYYTTTQPTEAEVEAGLTKQQNGTWWVLGEDGEYTDTKIPVSGVTVSGSEAEGYTFTIVDANGESQIVKLPSAASAITDILFAGTKVENNGATELGTLTSLGNDVIGIASEKFEFKNTWNSTKLLDKAADWKGNKKLPNDGDYIYSSPSTMNIRINPVDANVSTVPFYLTNTNNVDLQPIKFTAVGDAQGDKPMTGTDVDGRAAVAGNGLWTLYMENVVVAKNDYNSVSKGVADAVSGNWAYALNAGHASRSLYGLTVKNATPAQLTYLYFTQNGTTSSKMWIADGSDISVASGKYKVGAPVYLTVEQPSALYDMYIEPVKSSDINVYGLTFDQDAHSFTIGKNPDVSTVAASFELYVWTVDNLGQVRRETVTVNIDTEISAAAEYELQTHPVNHADFEDNHFGIDLSVMKQNLGTDGLQKWEQNVNLNLTSFDGIYTDAACTTAAARKIGDFDAYVVEKLADNTDVTAHETNVDKANFIQVNVDNANVNNLELGKTYYFKFTFKASPSENLKTIIVPVQFTAPTLAEQFVKESAVFVNGGNLAEAYMNVRDQLSGTTNTGTPAYSLKNAFESMPVNSGVTLTLADNDGLLDGDYNSDDLAGLAEQSSAATNTFACTDDVKIYLNNGTDMVMNDGTNRPLGYGQELTITANDARYGTANATAGWMYANKDGEYTFKIKVMSPIFEGTVTAVNNVFEIPATDIVNGYKMTNEDLNAVTYNNIAYDVMPDILVSGTAAGVESIADWSRPDIQAVSAESENTRVVRIGNNGNAHGATADKTDATKVAEEGYIQVIPENTAETKEATVNVNVTDIWGYVKSNPITVRVTVGE